MNYIIATIVPLICIVTLFNSSSVKENAWELRRNKNGIIVYTRKLKNSNLIEFKAITTLNTSIQKVRKIIEDVESYPKWMANLKQSETITAINNTERYDYFEIIVPWPFTNRDMVLHVKTLFPKNNIVFIELMNRPDYIPVKQNRVRVNKAKGSWFFLSIDENTTKVTYQLYSDPEGNIPTWVIDMLIVDGPYKTLINLQELVKTGK